MKTVAIAVEQNIYDIAVQEYGSIEGILQLRQLNDFSFSQDIQPGDDVVIDNNVVDKNIKEILQLYPKIATGNDFDKQVLEGIGYWAIGVDFVVS
jgi:hypothetical protein